MKYGKSKQYHGNIAGTCHLHGDSNCGRLPVVGEGYHGRLSCVKCNTVFCHNGLRKKFGIFVEGPQIENWVCMLCTKGCCCRNATDCRLAQHSSQVHHTHCHNLRTACAQRNKRKPSMTNELEAMRSEKRSVGKKIVASSVFDKLYSKKVAIDSSENSSALIETCKNVLGDNVFQEFVNDDRVYKIAACVVAAKHQYIVQHQKETEQPVKSTATISRNMCIADILTHRNDN